MNRFALMSSEDRLAVFAEAGERLQINPVVLEKDFWVCWMLGLLFGQAKWAEALVFKGGTALSKAFGIIRRFSEDIDLSVSPATLGISESEIEQAKSRRQRDQWMENLEVACRQWVRQQLQPELEHSIRAVLGGRPESKNWLEFETDINTHSPVLLYYYPSVLAPGADYIRRWVKLEFGSLTDQRPTGTHRVRPWVANILPGPLAEMGCDLVALEVQRAFWEKATILHAEYHREPATPMPGRYSRHYADLAAMANRPEVESALTDYELRDRVVNWKSQFFAESGRATIWPNLEHFGSFRPKCERRSWPAITRK